jgi:glycosyltransferase involved in cell wall biosynthesis
MKALQYMAAGVPTVASAVGANREVIEHGTNGLLAATTEEWLFCLTAVARDPDLRERIGQSGRATVVNGYSMRTSARKLEAVLNELLAPSTANPERRAPIH